MQSACLAQVRRRLHVSGIVQGVGFRPFVYRLAQRHQLTGHISNTSSGVVLEIQGDSDTLAQFVADLRQQAPALSQIESIQTSEVDCLLETGFAIHTSAAGPQANTLIAPDIATCADCLHELLDPADRRHHYPFINCAHCGPRFTILRRIPYDRANTSMAAFPMCPLCQQEYDAPWDRRFHAQPNACWQCGPALALWNAAGEPLDGDPMQQARALLGAGHILAIKGLGGFHLAVDAMNSAAVERLRLRKQRFEKPFAIMTATADSAAAFCEMQPDERALLESPQRPIVLMQARADSRLTASIAPGMRELGVFLPYTPVQHLLFTHGELHALVMTSGNLSDEPICIDNKEALTRLHGIADYFLVHNRDILLRCDDSVVRGRGGCTTMLRRSRGFVPVPVELAHDSPAVLAVGGELKNTICLLKGRHAFLGQHIGDLENLAAYHFFQESIQHLQQILAWRPAVIAHDLHPAYLSTQWAQQQTGIPKIAVQHHHAHIASCMAEHHVAGPVIGVALDGTGYGTDGDIWGGEVFTGDCSGFHRVAQLSNVPMPGGAQAIREPWRMAVAHLLHAGTDCIERGLPHLRSIPDREVEFIRLMAERRIQSPLTSSCGRLFDAVAALVGLRTTVSFEGQAAMHLEACAQVAPEEEGYLFAVSGDSYFEIQTGGLFVQILDDLARSVPAAIVSRRFHNGLVSVFAEVVRTISAQSGIREVCLSGGCFLNYHLASGLEQRLCSSGLRVYLQTRVPCGDGGLSLGQAAMAAAALF